MVGFIAPLDFEQIFVITLAGSPEIFSFLMIILIFSLAAYFRMPNEIALMLFGLFGVIMASYLGAIYILIILIGGLAVFYGISKIIKQ